MISLRCPMVHNCPFGRQHDENGCETCQCRSINPAPPAPSGKETSVVRGVVHAVRGGSNGPLSHQVPAGDEPEETAARVRTRRATVKSIGCIPQCLDEMDRFIAAADKASSVDSIDVQAAGGDPSWDKPDEEDQTIRTRRAADRKSSVKSSCFPNCDVDRVAAVAGSVRRTTDVAVGGGKWS